MPFGSTLLMTIDSVVPIVLAGNWNKSSATANYCIFLSSSHFVFVDADGPSPDIHFVWTTTFCGTPVDTFFLLYTHVHLKFFCFHTKFCFCGSGCGHQNVLDQFTDFLLGDAHRMNAVCPAPHTGVMPCSGPHAECRQVFPQVHRYPSPAGGAVVGESHRVLRVSGEAEHPLQDCPRTAFPC